jgi:hypothetical protein
MSGWSRLLGLVGTLIVLLGLLGTAQAQAANITGQIDGIELAPQADDYSHGALFVFGFVGQVDDGRTRKGWGWIEVFHDPLPEAGTSADVLGGQGVLWIGLRRFRIDILPGGQLTAPYPFAGVYGVIAPLDISPRWGVPVARVFDGELSHNYFPPRISGHVAPSE